MGCVLPASQGQVPARQAGFAAGVPQSVPAVTVNKICGSGMQAVMMGADAIRTGSADLVVAGGMESMSNAPYLLPKMCGGARPRHGQVIDSMFLDGLEDAYDKGRLMGTRRLRGRSQRRQARSCRDLHRRGRRDRNRGGNGLIRPDRTAA